MSWPQRGRLLIGGALLALLIAACVGALGRFASHQWSDFMAFAGAARLLASGSHCLYCMAPLAHAEGQYLGVHVPGPFAPFLPFLDPPLAAVLITPLAVLPPVLGLGIFLILSLAAIIAAWRLLVRLGAPPFIAWVAIASYSTSFALSLGQWDGLLTLALVVGLTQLERRPALAGLLFSCLLLEVQLGWLIPVALLGMGRWRALLGYAAGAAIWLITDPLILGPGHALDSLSAMLGAASTQMTFTASLPGAMAALAGPTVGWWTFWIALPPTLVLVYELARRSGDPQVMVAGAVALSLLISTHVLVEDLIVLAPALALAARRWSGLALAGAVLLSVPWNSGMVAAAPLAVVACATIAVLACEYRPSPSMGGGSLLAGTDPLPLQRGDQLLLEHSQSHQDPILR